MDAYACTISCQLSQGYTIRDEDNPHLSNDLKTARVSLPISSHDGLILDVDAVVRVFVALLKNRNLECSR